MNLPHFTANLQVIEHVFGPLDGRSLLDIGCGRGRLLRALARRGARVAGVEPNAALLAQAREGCDGARLEQCGGESMPFADGRFDGAIMMNALHHVPLRSMRRCMAEALRVVRPGRAFLVVEPLARGAYQQVFSPVDDETEVRATALRELDAFIAAGGVEVALRAEYDTKVREESAEAMLEHSCAIDPSRAERIEAVRAEVERRFAEHAVPDARGGFTLEQPMVAVALCRADI